MLSFYFFLSIARLLLGWNPCYNNNSAFNTGLRNEELVKAEAYHNCKNLVKWSGFLSILALSLVTGMKFFLHYPDCGLLKYKLLFNQAIFPRTPEKQIFNVHILFCYEGNLPVGDFHTIDL